MPAGYPGLPAELIRHTYTDYREVAAAIREMVIRGAPAIGVAAAMGIALGVLRSKAQSLAELQSEFPTICETMARTRPTAVDLFWAIDRMRRRFEELAANSDVQGVLNGLVAEARRIHEEKRAIDEAIGRFGASLMPESGQVMTQCNAGALATAGIGTALGVIRVAVESGRKLRVFVPETRPYLQGARLTAWELAEGGIPIGAALFDRNGKLLGRGHNRRVQEGDPSAHGETDAFRKAGRQRTYRDKIMVTTLAPCWYCSGLIRQFGISTVVVGESVNFRGGIDWLRENGVEVFDAHSSECVQMLGRYIADHPEIWNEDIGVD